MLKDKKSKTDAVPIREIKHNNKRYPFMIWTDIDSEFLGKEFQEIITGYYNDFLNE